MQNQTAPKNLFFAITFSQQPNKRNTTELQTPKFTHELCYESFTKCVREQIAPRIEISL